MQLTQPFLSEPVRSAHGNIDSSQLSGPRDLSPGGYENLDFAADLPDFLTDHSLHLPESDLHSYHGRLPEMLLTPYTGRLHYGHLRNVSIEDPNYRQTIGTRGHSHSLSMVLNLADPPSQIPHSHSSSTFLLVDLVPPLLLLVSNQLLADSPFSAVACATTPGRRGVSKSFSLSNFFATPSRTSHSPGVKVGKTPLKGHRRTRSKVVEVGSSNLLATIANMKSSSINHVPYEGDTSLMSNPFDTTLVSPRVDNLSDYDATPLTTPAKYLSSGNISAQYFTPDARPISHSNNFGGNLDPNELSQLRPSFAQSFSSSQNLKLGLPRSETLDSINIEDQEDDACKQLRKAKSFTTVYDPNLAVNRTTSLRNIRLDEYLASSPSKAHEPPVGMSSQNENIDLLLSEPFNTRKKGGLSSYPASIDLASITRLEPQLAPIYTNVGGPNGLLPPMATMRSAPAVPTLKNPLTHEDSPHDQSVSSASTPNLNYSTNLSSTNLKRYGRTGGKVGTPSLSYPSAMEIQEASTTQEIANFAEKILNSDLKRPIVVQEDSKDSLDPKKKHQCPLCFARFQRPEHVKRHLKSHSNEKPFACDYPDCNRRFNRKDNLKAHLKKIHKRVF